MIDLGISLTDLHGCDQVIWVEGETEEAVFPMLLRKFFPEKAQGIAVLPLYATGDFEAKKYEPKKVAQIYKRLSEGNFLAPPMIAIALDRESRNRTEIKQIEEDCDGVVHFLPRTMIEDYFLSAEAIAAMLSRESGNSVPIGKVQALIAEAQTLSECLMCPKRPASIDTHAAKVLRFLFNNAIGVAYSKTAHGPKILDWLLFNDVNTLADLKNWLTGMLYGKGEPKT